MHNLANQRESRDRSVFLSIIEGPSRLNRLLRVGILYTAPCALINLEALLSLYLLALKIVAAVTNLQYIGNFSREAKIIKRPREIQSRCVPLQF